MPHTTPLISAQIVRHVRNCLELAGHAAPPLLSASGIPSNLVDDRDAQFPLGAYVQFFERAAHATANPHFGLHAAKLMSADGLGPLSFLFLTAPTLERAFRAFTEGLGAMQEGTFNAFLVEETCCHFTYAIQDREILLRRQDAEYSIGAMCNLVRQYLGRHFAPIEVHFEHERLGAAATYDQYFGCPVFFEQPHNRFYMPSALLGRGSSAFSTELFPIIAEHVRQRTKAVREAESMRDQIRSALRVKRTEMLPSLEDMAREIGLSPATIKRRLAREGCGYGALVTERRLEHARQLMTSGMHTIADVALACGYSEAASFTRAFARQHGTSPSAWRRGTSKTGHAAPSRLS